MNSNFDLMQPENVSVHTYAPTPAPIYAPTSSQLPTAAPTSTPPATASDATAYKNTRRLILEKARQAKRQHHKDRCGAVQRRTCAGLAARQRNRAIAEAQAASLTREYSSATTCSAGLSCSSPNLN